MRYAIGDIHGCARTLVSLLNKLKLKDDDVIYFLGDYIDRGLDSKGVLDVLMNLTQAVCLCGNHEEFMLESKKGRLGVFQQWLANGGGVTLQSFDNKPIPEKYYNFIKAMPKIIQLPDYYIAHAGISVAGLDTPPDILLWDRGCMVDPTMLGGRKLVCGHTPTKLDEIEQRIKDSSKLILDNGCVYDGAIGYGKLLALNLDTLELITQDNIDQIERDN